MHLTSLETTHSAHSIPHRRDHRVLYLTLDGVLEPIGYSQVARSVGGLAQRGWRYTLLSLERRSDLRDQTRRQRIANELSEVGVRWIPLEYAEGGRPWHVSRNLAVASAAVLRIVRQERIELIHARSYLPGTLALALHRAMQIRYLFDFRGYWLDERVEAGRRFTNSRVLQTARVLERALFNQAAAVVSLTQLAVDDLAEGRTAPRRVDQPLCVIPTCVDYDVFNIRDQQLHTAIPADIAARLAGKLVIGYVGAINASYWTHESITLFERIRRRRPDAHLLCLTRQGEAMRQALAQQQVPASAFTIATASQDEMPHWLPWIRWGFLMLRESFAKRASMPTKLAEFFAAGVRPIHYGCNREVGDWVARCGSGHSLRALDEQEFTHAAEIVANTTYDLEVLRRARDRAEPHFSLRSGLDRYDALLTQILAHSPSQPVAALKTKVASGNENV
jgi:hypothetical protein